MQLAVMDPADRDGEFIAHPSSECTRLSIGEMMRVGWDATTHKARLPEHEPAVLLIAQPNRFAERMQHLRAGYFLGPLRTFGAATHIRAGWVRASKRHVVNRIARAAGLTSLSIAALESLARKLSSIIFASAAVRLFFAARFRCAQAAASSAELMPASCSTRLSRRLADS